MRSNAINLDFSSVLPEELEKEVKDAAEISMGTEISAEDIENISFLASTGGSCTSTFATA
jgi:nucleolar protein 58